MLNSKGASLSDIKVIQLELKSHDRSHLVAYDEINKAGAIRCFSISALANQDRGNHSHILSRQWFVVMGGRVTIEVFDGKDKLQHLLLETNEVLFVPAGIWSRQIYSAKSNLLVFTDTQYEESDYIRSLSDYLKWKSE